MWEGDGSKSSVARLARDGHTSKGAAQRVLLRGRRLDAAPVVASAFVAGDLSADQVDLLLAAQAGREGLFARDEETLVEQARELRVGQLHKAMEYWRHRADAEVDPDGPEPKLPTPSVTFTPIDGAVAITVSSIPSAARSCPARWRRSPTSSPPSIPSSTGQPCGRWRWSRWPAAPWPYHPARSRHGSWPTSPAEKARSPELCELANGTIIHPGHLVPYLGALDIRSILYDAANRAVAVSSRRTFVGSLRSVVEVRDLHCQHASGCDEPIDACDVDHIIPVCHGGETSQDNGRLMCMYHNRIEPQYARPPTGATPDP